MSLPINDRIQQRAPLPQPDDDGEVPFEPGMSSCPPPQDDEEEPFEPEAELATVAPAIHPDDDCEEQPFAAVAPSCPPPVPSPVHAMPSKPPVAVTAGFRTTPVVLIGEGRNKEVTRQLLACIARGIPVPARKHLDPEKSRLRINGIELGPHIRNAAHWRFLGLLADAKPRRLKYAAPDAGVVVFEEENAARKVRNLRRELARALPKGVLRLFLKATKGGYRLIDDVHVPGCEASVVTRADYDVLTGEATPRTPDHA